MRYWQLPEPNAARAKRPVADLERELVAHLEEAVRLRMIADVPLGAFLSGGVDSSAVVAMMARAGAGRVKTFSIGFPAKEYDETRYARMVAERYGTEHEEFIVEPDAVAILPKLVWHYGEPFADPSAIPTYYVSQMARRHVTVALNGDGGDEAFLGYARYRAMRHLSQLDRLPEWGRLALARLLACAPSGLQRELRLPQIRDILEASSGRSEQRYAGTIVFFADRDKEAGYGEAMRSHLDRSALDLLAPYFAAADGLVAGANWADLHTYLPDDLMVKVDVASMAHGLETRSPLLDHVLLEWALSIPADVRMAGPHQGAAQIGDGAVPAARADPPQEDGIRLSDRRMAAQRAQTARLRHAAGPVRARAGVAASRLCSPPARRALLGRAQPSHAAVGAVDAGAVVQDVDRRLRRARDAAARGLTSAAVAAMQHFVIEAAPACHKALFRRPDSIA